MNQQTIFSVHDDCSVVIYNVYIEVYWNCHFAVLLGN